MGKKHGRTVKSLEKHGETGFLVAGTGKKHRRTVKSLEKHGKTGFLVAGTGGKHGYTSRNGDLGGQNLPKWCPPGEKPWKNCEIIGKTWKNWVSGGRNGGKTPQNCEITGKTWENWVSGGRNGGKNTAEL